MNQRFLLVCSLTALLASAGTAAAETCADNPDVLGTSRTLTLDTSAGFEAGHQFRHSLPLAKKEVVLTFDDGPIPASSEKVRQALKAECVKATFFLVGRNAANYPDFVRKLAADGHTIASHTWSHDMKMPEQTLASGLSQINRGIAAINVALKSSPDQSEVAPFFRFPGLNSTHALRDILKERGVGIFDIDIEGGDWLRNKTPQDVFKRVVTQLHKQQRGIILLHDIQPRTAAMLPDFLKLLKKEGYKVVHIVPKPEEKNDLIASTSHGGHLEDNVSAELPASEQPFQTAHQTMPDMAVASAETEAEKIIAEKPARKKRAAQRSLYPEQKLQAMATVAPLQPAPEQLYIPRRTRAMQQAPVARYADMGAAQQASQQKRERPKYLLNELFGIGTN